MWGNSIIVNIVKVWVFGSFYGGNWGESDFVYIIFKFKRCVKIFVFLRIVVGVIGF